MSRRARNRGTNRSGRSSQPRRQQGRGGRPPKRGGATFWGTASSLPFEQPEVRITEDPSVVVRSLGPPPLAGHESVAEHYFAAVYDRVVTLAGALAAAGDLIKPEELAEERSD